MPAEQTTKGQVWEATILPVDEKAVAGTPFTASITIENAAPTADVSVSPEEPESGAALEASATGEDVEGDALSWTYSWTIDGVERAAARKTHKGPFCNSGKYSAVPQSANPTRVGAVVR